MRICLAHNEYGTSAPSGENAVFEAEKKLLQEYEHEVSISIRHSDDIRSQGFRGTIKGGLSTPWNIFSYYKVKKLINTEKPDILHVHNFFPLFSPSIFHAAKGQQTATVLTLHNYRLFCAAGIPMRDGKTCTDCLDQHSTFPGLQHGCYRNSNLATLPMAAMISLHRLLGTWQKHVDAFIALTTFQKNLMIAAGLPEDRVYIKPHFYANPPSPVPWDNRPARVVYMGRLSEEKGVKNILEAWQKWGEKCPQLDIIGDGPLRSKLQTFTEKTGLSGKITYWGQLPFATAQEKLGQARLLLLPSLCFEGFPMVIREAFALGVPVAASDLGAMPCIINNGKEGTLFRSGDAVDIYNTVRESWEDQEKLVSMGQNARSLFEEKYMAASNHSTLLGIYNNAIETRCNKHEIKSCRRNI